MQDNLTSPLITNLKLDPFERFHEARGFDEWQENRAWILGPAMEVVVKFLDSFKDYPVRQQSADYSVDELVNNALNAGGNEVKRQPPQPRLR